MLGGESGKPTDRPKSNRTCCIVGIVVGVLCGLAVIAGIVIGVVVATAGASLANALENATSTANASGISVKASFADLEGDAFYVDGRRRRMDAPYGDANTQGSVAGIKEISSFKVSPLQIVMCTEPPEANRYEGQNTVMGVGVSNGAANIVDQFDRYGCHVVCGRQWKLNTDAASLANFGEQCKSNVFPAGTFTWGWVIWAPIAKMTASVTLADGTVVRTKATDMNADAGADWGSSAEPAAVASDSLTGGGAAEESMFWLYGAR